MDVQAACDITIEISKQAGKILQHYFTSQNFNKHTKGLTGDVVTQADTETDAFIRQKLSERFPHVHIMSEETTSGDYRSLKEKEWLFIVDPLDGTINFTRNTPHFGVSIGLLHKGKIVMSVARLPMQDETYWADDVTVGAFLNSKQIAVSSATQMKEMVIACDWSNNLEARNNMLKILERITQDTRRIKSLGSPVSDLCLVAKGDIDAYIHTRLRPWDITPAYIVQKAGGIASNFRRADWDVFRLDLIAGNPHAHEQLAKYVHYASSADIV